MRPSIRHTIPICLVLVGLATTACQSISNGDNEEELSSELAAELTEIETLCGLPKGSLAGKAGTPSEFSKIACAVEEAQKRNLNIGFISNPVDPNAQTH